MASELKAPESRPMRPMMRLPHERSDGSFLIPEELIVEFLSDPVMAARILMGAELDVFQAVRLRIMWFCPEVIDSSGVSTAKSEVIFIWANLIAMLLTNPDKGAKRKVMIFYQSLSIAEETFWAKYKIYREKSPLFQSQLKPGVGGRYGSGGTGNAREMLYWNGNSVGIMAGAFARDSETLASLRVTDGGVDEFTVVDKMGDGIDNQLRDRVTAATYNKDHPLWANHLTLMGHAEDSDHPSHRRIVAFKKAIRDGSSEHFLFTACYLDYTKKFERFLNDRAIRRGKLLPLQKFELNWLGVNRSGSRGYYPSTSLEGCHDPEIRVEFGRTHSSYIYALGADVSYGTGQRIDDNALFSWKGEFLGSEAPADARGCIFFQDYFWRVSPCWALLMKDQSVDEYSGVVHMLQRKFGFSTIVLDPLGGGGFVARKLRDKRQLIGGEWKEKCTELVTPDQHYLYPEGLPLVNQFKRGEQLLDCLWDERQMGGDEGIVEGAHDLFSDAFQTQSLLWPTPLKDRAPFQRDGLSASEFEVHGFLDICLAQIGNVQILTKKDGAAFFSKRGFRSFRAKGKKDGAYAAMYGFVGLLAHFKRLVEDGMDDDDGSGCIG
jgi:hypothetical protein